MRIFSILICLMSLLPAFKAVGKEYYFTHYDITNGLSQNTVHKILQDKSGFMWFATKDGLNRFDGRNFRRIDLPTEEGNYFYISSLFEDSQGMIWVGTHKGPYVYSPETECLGPIFESPDDDKNIHYAINDFEELPDGRIVFAVENHGIYTYDPRTKELLPHFDNILGKLPSIMALCYSETGKVYIGTFGSGLYYADKNFKQLRQVTDQRSCPYFENFVINTIKKDGDRIFIGTANNGIHVLEESTGNIYPVFTKDENGRTPFIRDINFSNSTEIIIGSETGLYIYDLADKKIKRHLTHNYVDPYSISDDAIYSVCFDRDEGLWLGSYFGGIDYQGVQQPEFIKYIRNVGPYSLQSERIRELCHDPKGLIYIASEDNGLSVFNPATGQFRIFEGITEKNIQTLCLEGDNLWIGTFSEGIVKINTTTGKIKRYRAGLDHGLINNYVFSIDLTAGGDLYIGSFTGLQKYDRESDKFEEIEQLSGLFIYDIKEDREGNLWVGTYSNGLFLRKPGESNWINYLEDTDNSFRIPSNKIYGIQEDSHDKIWVMTQNGPCVFSKDGVDDRFVGVDRIPGVVYCMEEDAYGRYWFTSNHGIYCIEPQTKEIWNFTVKDGLPTNQFNYHSSLKTPEGKIYFGSIDGMVCFDPQRFFPENDQKIKPVVSELYVHSSLMKPGMPDSPLKKSICQTNRLELEPWQNSFALNVVTLNYNQPSAKIKYKLEGYDRDWRYVDTDEGPINYTNVSPGHYIFKAVASNPDGRQVGNMREMEIVVATPFYKTWWAILIYSILGIGIICFIFIIQRRYSRLSNERYAENYKHTKEIEIYDSKIKFFTNVAHEIRTPLTLIKAPIDTIIKREDLIHDPEIKDNLEVINMNVDRLLQLTDQLLDFRKLESGNYQFRPARCDVKATFEELLATFLPTIEATKKKLEITIPEEPLMASIDKEAFIKILTNLISNAIKYSQSNIKISLDKRGDEVVFKIANDGDLITTEDREKIFSLFLRLDSNAPGTGIGLTFSRNLASLQGGVLYMEDSDKENIFVLRLPDVENKTETVNNYAESDLEKIVKNSGDKENVLIVEDNLELLGFLQKRLEANNYNVFTANEGEEALSVLQEKHIDIVISDVMMPGMNGIELLKQLKSNMRFSHIPVVLLTAKTMMQDKLEGLEAGADYYIEKPFSMEYLLAGINSLLRNRDRVRNRVETEPLEKIPEKGLTKSDEDFLKKMNEIIIRNFNNPEFSVDNIIEEMGLGSTTFYRKVKVLLNLNPNQYIKLQRLKKAAQLFREGYSSVSEVCYMVGFSSPGYFAKCFQQQYGIPPKEYMKGKEI